MGEREVALSVVENELKLAEVLVQPAPVAAKDVAVQVVLGPDAVDLVVRALPEVGPLGAGEDLRVHAAAARRSAA